MSSLYPHAATERVFPLQPQLYEHRPMMARVGGLYVREFTDFWRAITDLTADKTLARH